MKTSTVTDIISTILKKARNRFSQKFKLSEDMNDEPKVYVNKTLHPCKRIVLTRHMISNENPSV